MNSDLYIRALSDLDGDIREMGLDDVFSLCKVPLARKRALQANPFVSDGHVPAQVLGLVDNKVVGHEFVFPVRIKAKDGSYEAIAGSGLFVHKEYRKSMLGVSLITKREELSNDGIALGCGLSSLALPAHLMFDYLCYPMPRLMWLFKSRAVVENKLGKSAVSRLVSWLLDCLLGTLTQGLRMIGLLKARRMLLEEQSSADEEVAELVRKDPHAFSCGGSAAWLNWNLKSSLSDDNRNKQKLFVVKEKNGHVIGFFMYKVRFHETASQRGYKNLLLGSLTEWQSADRRRLSHAVLALKAILEMKKDGVDAVEICTDEKDMFGSLKKLGLFHVGDLSFVMRATESSPLRLCDGWNRQEGWRLRPAAGDNGVS